MLGQPEATIHLESLRFSWPKTHAYCLEIDSLDIEAGESVLLHGESGGGKSTLLALLGGVLTPESGAIRLLGTDLVQRSPAERDRFRADHIGFIFQQFNLIPYLSVLDNVLLSCRFSVRRMKRALENGKTAQDEAIRLLEHLGIAQKDWHRRASELSVGQQQRVAAARALIGRPEILLADEPTSALDSARQIAFLQLLAGECKAANTALLFVSHDVWLSSHFSRTIALEELNRPPVPA